MKKGDYGRQHLKVKVMTKTILICIFLLYYGTIFPFVIEATNLNYNECINWRYCSTYLDNPIFPDKQPAPNLPNPPKLLRKNLGRFHFLTRDNRNVVIEVEIGYLQKNEIIVEGIFQKNPNCFQKELNNFFQERIVEIELVISERVSIGLLKDNLANFINEEIWAISGQRTAILVVFIPVFCVGQAEVISSGSKKNSIEP